MSYSFYEIYTTSQRAFRGMGFPFGADEDAAYIIAWLELNNLNGVDIFKNIIKEIDQKYDGTLSINNIIEKIDFKDKSILMKGSGLIDYLQSIINPNQKILITIKNCSDGILFLPILHKANRNINCLDLIFRDSNNKINEFRAIDNKILLKIIEKDIKNNEVKIILSNGNLNKTTHEYKEIITEKTIQKNLSKSLQPKENDWEKISKIANRTFVPETEESRNKGAGGGDAND